MKEKSKAVLGAFEAVSERSVKSADKIVPLNSEPVAEIGEMGFDVKPSEMVSIVAGNRSLLLRDGVVEITVK